VNAAEKVLWKLNALSVIEVSCSSAILITTTFVSEPLLMVMPVFTLNVFTKFLQGHTFYQNCLENGKPIQAETHMQMQCQQTATLKQKW
jgi:hypothetical protein